jgi:hypothetical protein
MKTHAMNAARNDTCSRTAAILRAAAAGLLLAAAPALRAENVIAIGHGEGAPGARDVSVIITAANDAPMHGYSLALTYPAHALTLTSVTTSGTHVDAIRPDFVAPAQDNQLGIGTLGVIFSFKEPITAKELAPLATGAFPRIIARLTFDVKPEASAGLYDLVLQDGIGRPATYNVFTNRGISVKPRLVNGSFSVTGAGNFLMLERKQAIAGVTPNLIIHALARHPDPLVGFQIAVRYENTLDLKSVTFLGTELDRELGAFCQIPGDRRCKIEVFDALIDPAFSPTHGRCQVGVLFDFNPPHDGQTLSPSNASPPNQTLLKFTFEVKGTADDVRQYTDLILDTAGIPGLIDSRLFSETQSIDPMLRHGKVYFSTGSLTGKVVDAVTGQAVSGVRVTADDQSTTTLPDGTFRFSGLPPGDYVLFLSKTDYFSNKITTTQSGEPIRIVGSNLETNVGTIPIYKIPTITTTPKPFLRGYINPDSRPDISDGIFLLAYLFQGGDRPGCLQASDVNDDNKLDLSDPIWMLNYLFAGASPPRPPFSSNGTGCAFDPTPGGTLDCATFNFCK